jgi:hypothetical protein
MWWRAVVSGAYSYKGAQAMKRGRMLQVGKLAGSEKGWSEEIPR